jgi:ATP-dependent helicase/nuclease subunit A
VHRLLQSLPELSAERRRDLALDYLGRNAGTWSDAEREALAAQVLALIDEPRFSSVFGPGSRAEVPIVGRLEGRLVSGQIDRLAVTPAEILIVDYKTNHAPPATPAEAPEGYVRQLALYRAVLSRLYPQRAVRAALLWTETPDLMEISTSALDAALASLSSRREPA